MNAASEWRMNSKLSDAELAMCNDVFRHRALDSRKNDVIVASIQHADKPDEYLADMLICSKATVRKWRKVAHDYEAVFLCGGKGSAKMKLRARLKVPVYERKGGEA